MIFHSAVLLCSWWALTSNTSVVSRMTAPSCVGTFDLFSFCHLKVNKIRVLKWKPHQVQEFFCCWHLVAFLLWVNVYKTHSTSTKDRNYCWNKNVFFVHVKEKRKPNPKKCSWEINKCCSGQRVKVMKCSSWRCLLFVVGAICYVPPENRTWRTQVAGPDTNRLTGPLVSKRRRWE